MGLTTANCGQGEAIPDLNPFDRLNPHERSGESGIQASISLTVRAQSGGKVVGQDLHHAAQGVTVALRLGDLGQHRSAGAWINAAHRVGVDPGQVIGSGQGAVRGAGRTDAYNVTEDLDPERLSKKIRSDRPQSHPGCGLPRRGPLQDRAGIVPVVLLHAGQVGVPRPRARQRRITSQLLQFLGGHGIG